jgi:ribose 5-phosphate isomerase B
MIVAIGADDAAFELRDAITAHLQGSGLTVTDLSPDTSAPDEYYPAVAERVATAVAEGRADRGVLVCGTGIGMCITANKIPGVRAALCHDTYSAERARKSNDAQVLTMGARVIGVELAKTIVSAFLTSEFAGGRSAPKVALMGEIDDRYRSLSHQEQA